MNGQQNIKCRSDHFWFQLMHHNFTATRHRINQEIKFQYAKKQKIKEQLHKIHLECAYKWPITWQMIQTVIDNNIQLQMEKQYANLNKKTGQPNQETNRKPHNETRRRQQPVPYKNRKSHKHHVQQRRVKLWCMSWNQN
jgi:hypothetical protein